MTLSEQNLIKALNLGLITWFQFFEEWRKLKCEIVSIEIYDGDLDYLCRPLDTSKLVLGQSELGAGWVRAENIEEI